MGINPALDYLSMPSSVEIKAGSATANYKTFLQTCTDEVRCDGSILAELLGDAILARIVLAVNF